jgi:hypothetical protein
MNDEMRENLWQKLKRLEAEGQAHINAGREKEGWHLLSVSEVGKEIWVSNQPDAEERIKAILLDAYPPMHTIPQRGRRFRRL